jgi:uncharacterized protein (TIGR02118 family)
MVPEIIMKLVALYKQPEDVEAFEREYAHHVTLVEAIPGLESVALTRFSRTLAGDGFYLMAEMNFPDKDTFKAAMRSPEMGAVGEDIQRFAGHLMTLLIGSAG